MKTIILLLIVALTGMLVTVLLMPEAAPEPIEPAPQGMDAINCPYLGDLRGNIRLESQDLIYRGQMNSTFEPTETLNKCPKCGANLWVNYNIAYTSHPVCYGAKCHKCDYSGYVN